jgi:hypothetical protein
VCDCESLLSIRLISSESNRKQTAKSDLVITRVKTPYTKYVNLPKHQQFIYLMSEDESLPGVCICSISRCIKITHNCKVGHPLCLRMRACREHVYVSQLANASILHTTVKLDMVIRHVNAP